MYSLETTKQVDKRLEKDTVLAKRFWEWIDRALLSPHTEHDGQMKNSFYDVKQVYKKRLGDFRALLTIDDNTLVLLVFKLGHRNDVYDD